MAQAIVFNFNNAMCVIYPTPEYLAGDTIENHATDKVPPATSHDIIDTTVIGAADEYFHGAWTWNTTTQAVDVDMPKARTAHMEQLKQLRLQKWDAMGVPRFMNSSFDSNFSAGDQTTLTSLRDMETAEDLSTYTTPATLKAYTPTYLA